MDIAQLIEISLANSDPGRVEVAALEPAEITMEAVSSLAQLVSELVDNAIAFSEPGQRVRVTGLFEQANYLISISDRGIGMPAQFMEELNRVLDNPAASGGSEPKLGIALVARMATRHGIEVVLVPGVPGTTARVTVPARIATPSVEEESGAQRPISEHRLPPRELPAPSVRSKGEEVFASSTGEHDMIDLTRHESGHSVGSGVIAMSETARREAESFLQSVFAPLMARPGLTERPHPRPKSNGNGRAGETAVETPRPRPPETVGTVTALRRRVPGENFAMVEDDPSTVAAERAIDIKSALSKYEQGRRSAIMRDDD